MTNMVSVIVPTKNSGETIKKCLESILSQTYKNIEIIVVDNYSTDKTRKIIEDFQKSINNKQKSIIYFYSKGPERSSQRNFGATKAKGEYFLFVDSDMELANTVVSECIGKLKTENLKHKIGGIIIPEKSIGMGFWAKCKALERSFYVGVDWIEAARFFSKKIFKEFKGYDEKQTGTEDYDLPQRIKAKYGADSIKRISSYIIHNEGNLSLLKTLSKKYYYAKTAKVYATKKSNSAYFKKQSSIMERYKLFFSKPDKLFKDLPVGIGMLFMKTLEFAAGGLGFYF